MKPKKGIFPLPYRFPFEGRISERYNEINFFLPIRKIEFYRYRFETGEILYWPLETGGMGNTIYKIEPDNLEKAKGLIFEHYKTYEKTN